jgi:hypothetical protein
VPNAAPDHHRPCILVAVADAVTREVVAQMLHVAGFAVLDAATGERALLALRERRTGIDWLVAGTGLPGLVDASILGDEFASLHPGRKALLLAEPGAAAGRALPSPAEVVGALQALLRKERPGEPAAAPEPAQTLAA